MKYLPCSGEATIELFSQRLAQYLQNGTTGHKGFEESANNLCFNFTTKISGLTATLRVHLKRSIKLHTRIQVK